MGKASEAADMSFLLERWPSLCRPSRRSLSCESGAAKVSRKAPPESHNMWPTGMWALLCSLEQGLSGVERIKAGRKRQSQHSHVLSL